jgi:hypothetical protein
MEVYMTNKQISTRERARKTDGTVALRMDDYLYRIMTLEEFIEEYGDQIRDYSVFNVDRLSGMGRTSMETAWGLWVDVGIDLGFFVFDEGKALFGDAYLEKFGDAVFTCDKQDLMLFNMGG